MTVKALLAILLLVVGCGQASMELTEFPEVREKASKGTFPLAGAEAASICVDISSLSPGKHKVTVHLLDPGIVLQEIRIK